MELNDHKRSVEMALVDGALRVVLQYWMIPDLGWSTTLYKYNLPKIREEIIEDRLRYEVNLTEDAREEQRKALRKRYSKNYLYFDKTHLALLQAELNQENAETHLDNLQV